MLFGASRWDEGVNFFQQMATKSILINSVII